MSVISSILQSSDKIKALNESPTIESIPALLYILMSEEFTQDSELITTSRGILTKILTDSQFDASVVLMDENVSSEKPQRRQLIEPQKSTNVTMRTLALAFHMFTHEAENYDEIILRDVLDLLPRFLEIQRFTMCTRMLLDATDFCLNFFDNEDSNLTKQAQALFQQIHEIAIRNNNLDVMLVTNSVHELFNN